MSDRTAKRAREIYLELSTLDENAVSAELDRLAAGDPELREAVISVIDAEARADDAGFMSSPTASTTAMSATITETAGTVIGRYKLLQLIGEGGFGSVFLAEQARPVRRRVALKIIKLGMDTKQVIARFEAERQALAMMDHPHIARVYDAGATETGRPYFAMEYVVGDAITRFADAHKLSIAERLALFAQVCSAVQHAHTKGVIHRDLKPANVLVSMVDGKPYAKVIDFGIAKATASPLTEKTLFTEHRQLIGTPEYMSPEQAEGSPDIDTRTDVYALGVLLNEMLTGVTPFDGKRLLSAGFGEMQRIIKEEDPPAPSMRLTRNLETLAQTAMARQVDPAKLSTAVRGELDWIVMKALDKDRGRRYESAAQLAMDIANHLAGEAVVAAPPSRGYRVRKFVRRNKGAVIAGSAVSAALLVGLAGTAWGWNAARQSNKELTENLDIARESLLSSIVQTVDLDEDERLTLMEQSGISENEARREQAEAYVEGLRHGRRFLADKEGRSVTSSELNDIALLSLVSSMSVKEIVDLRDKLQLQAEIAQDAMDRISEIVGCDDCDQEDSKVIGDVFFSAWKQTEEAQQYIGAPEEELRLRALGAFGILQSKQLRSAIYEAEWSAYTANIALAQQALDAGNYPEARKRLSDCPEGKRGWEWTFTNLQCSAVSHQIEKGSECLFSPVDSRVAVYSNNTYSNENIVWIYDNTDFENAIAIKRVGNTEYLHSVAWSPDGTKLLLGVSDGTAQIHKADGTGTPLVLKTDSRLRSAEWNHNGTQILTVGDEAVQTWDATGTQRNTIVNSRGDAFISDAHWSPTNDSIAVVFSDGSAGLSSPESDEFLDLLGSSKTCPWRLNWSSDGRRVAIVPNQITESVRILNAIDAIVHEIPSNGSSTSIDAEWDPSGQRLLVSFTDGNACIYNVADDTTMHLKGAHRHAIWDLCWSPDGTKAFTASFNGIVCWDAMKGTPLGPVVSEPSDDPWRVSALPDGKSLLVSNSLAYESGPVTRIIPIDAWGGPERRLVRAWRDIPASVYLDRINSTTNGSMIAGDSIVTPDGSRRIEYSGRTLKFITEATGKEVAVLGFATPIASLSLTSDGNQLIVSMENGYSRVWDIRDAVTRRKDLQIEWAERVPAGAYLDTLWNSDTATESLMDAIIADQSLTPLRRLVAAEMLDERQQEAKYQAEQVFKELTDGQTDKALLLESVRAAELHPRVRDHLVAWAKTWEYVPPKPNAEEALALETQRRRLAEANAAIRSVDAGASAKQAELDRAAVIDAIRTYRELDVHHSETEYAAILGALSTVALGEYRYMWAESALRAGEPSYALNLILETPLNRLHEGRFNGDDMTRVYDEEDDPNTQIQSAWNQANPCELAVLAMIRINISKTDQEWLDAASRVDQRLLGVTLSREQHQLIALDTFEKAKTLMANPAAVNEAGVPWAQDLDALELLAEAEKLLKGLPESAE